MTRTALTERAVGYHLLDARATITLLVASVALSVMRFRGADFPMLTLDGPTWPSQPWTLFTSCLLHGDVLHLLMNALWLVQLGVTIEALYGTRATAFFYVLSGSGSMAAQWLQSSHAIGLSGIVYAQLGLLWALARWHPAGRGILDPRIARWMIAWFFLCIVFTRIGVMEIANWAHGVGAVLGVIAGRTLSIRRDLRGWRWFAFPLASVLLIAATFLLLPRGARIGRAIETWRRALAAQVDENAQEAERLYLESIGLHETAAARWNLYLVLREQPGRQTEALASRARALELDPGIEERNRK